MPAAAAHFGIARGDLLSPTRLYAKGRTAQNAGVIVRSAQTDIFRVGAFANDNYEVQYRATPSSAWTSALSVNKTTGAIAISGALTLAAANFSGAVDVAGNFSVATNKLTVAAASGNVAIAGTVAVADTTEATSTTAASVMLAGGLGIVKKLFVGGTTNLAGALTLSAALTYGGVTLNNAVTGAGNMVLSAGPTFTGTITAATINGSGVVTLSAGVPSLMLSTTNGANNNVQMRFHGGSNNADLWAVGTDVAGGSGSKDFHLYNLTNSLVALTVSSAVSNAGTVTVGYSTASSATSNGALVVTGGAGVGGRVTANNFASTIGPGATAAFDATGQTPITLANGANGAVASLFRTLIIVTCESTGDIAIYLGTTAFGCLLVASVGGTFVASTTTPAAGKASVASNGSSWNAYNNTGGSSNFYAWSLKLV